jgi:hypothetical protein
MCPGPRGQPDALLDVRPLKARVARLLEINDPYRKMIEDLPDWVPKERGLDLIRVCLAHFAPVKEA